MLAELGRWGPYFGGNNQLFTELEFSIYVVTEVWGPTPNVRKL